MELYIGSIVQMNSLKLVIPFLSVPDVSIYFISGINPLWLKYKNIGNITIISPVEKRIDSLKLKDWGLFLKKINNWYAK